MHPRVVAAAKVPAGLSLSLQLPRCLIVHMRYPPIHRRINAGVDPHGHMLRRCCKAHAHTVRGNWGNIQVVVVLTSALLLPASLLLWLVHWCRCCAAAKWY